MKFKTNICKNFMAGLGCQRGARCHFAHGEAELRKEDQPLPDIYVEEVCKQQQLFYS